MITADSISFQVSNDSLKRIDRKQFLNAITFDGEGKEIVNKLYLKDQSLGLKNISISKRNYSTEIELSSKILKENYKDLIHKNNIELVVKKINDLGAVQFDTNEFIDSALVHRIDITNNLKPETSIVKICRDLFIYSTANKYKVERADTNTGLTVNGIARSNKERMIFYDKFEELNRNIKTNRILKQSININDFTGVLRVENNLRSYADIRSAFGLSSGKTLFLKDLLSSRKKVNYNSFVKMFDLNNTDNLDFALLNERKVFIRDLDLEARGFANYQKLVGNRQIVINCDYNIKLIYYVVKSKVKGNAHSAYIPMFKKLIKEMRCEILGDIQSINEVTELLLVA